MAKYHSLRGHAVYVSRNLARRIIPILKWVVEVSPRKKEKSQAEGILKKIYKIEDWRQVLLTKGELELLSFIRTEFPEGVPPEEGEQLVLFTSSVGKEATYGKQPPTISERYPGLKPPIVREKEVKPTLKDTLTKEDQDERESTIKQSRYKPLPESHWQKNLQNKE